MSYSTLIRREQGGSVLAFTGAASLVLGDSVITFGSALPTHAAVAGAIYFRGGTGAGSAANIYVNATNSASTGTVWKSASLFTPA